LVLVGEKVDLRRRLYKLMTQAGRALEFRVPYERELPAWAQQYARSQGLRLDPDAAGLLCLYVGANLRELASEVGKLAIYAGQGARINRHTVEEVVAPGASPFHLADAIGRREYPRAAALLHQLLGQGEEPIRALGLISRHLQILLKVQGLARQNLPRDQFAAEVGVSPFFLGGYLEQARRFPRQGLWEGLKALREADARLKSMGRRQEGLTMDLLLHRLCSTGPAAQG
jgi:DNA polymerase-3 subunit delta